MMAARDCSVNTGRRAAGPGKRSRALRRRLPLAAPVVALLATVLAACGGSSSDRQTPTPPADGSPTPAATASPPPGPAVDLASDSADMTIWGGASGDFFSDLPQMATGDFNDDGLADILIGARFGDGPGNGRRDAGEAYVVFGSQNLPESVDLAAGEQDLTIWGTDADDSLGFSARSGDVNRDGVDDILVGAPFASRDPSSEGREGAAYVVFGSSALGGSVDTAAAEQDVTLWGATPSGFFGDSLATGDVNGDGGADLIIGATFAARRSEDGGLGDQVGAVYVVFGTRSPPAVRDMAEDEYDLAIFGAEDLDEVGDAVASGDVNDDGIDDLLVVAEAADGPDNDRSTAGEVYVKFGSRDLRGEIDIGRGEQDVTIFGGDASDIFGFSIASGDIDGDGIDDLLVGARGADGPGNSSQEAGQIYIFPGSATPPSLIDTAQEGETMSLVGDSSADLMAALALGDLDGDGTAEIVAGLGYGDGPGDEREEAGEAFVLSGVGLHGAMPVSSGRVSLVVYGAASGDRLGAAVASGDVDGDGRADIVLMAVEGDGPGGSRRDAGQVYVIRGGR